MRPAVEGLDPQLGRASVRGRGVQGQAPAADAGEELADAPRGTGPVEGSLSRFL